MNKYVKKVINFAGRDLILESGELALQANIAVKATYGESVILVTAVAGEASPDIDFFPLTVNYEEKLYANGQIKSSRFVKRDGKANDEAVITKRLIDHAIRPLFPNGYMDEVQVVLTVLSLDENADPEFLGMIATSAALHASNIPWEGPMTSLKVGLIEGQFVANPSTKDLDEKSKLSMMISFVGKDRKFLAVESESHVLTEEMVLGSMEFSRNTVEPLVDFINDFANEVNPGLVKYEFKSKAVSKELIDAVAAIGKDKFVGLLKQTMDKIEMKKEEAALKAEVFAALEGKYTEAELTKAFEELEKRAIQHLILDEGKRPDGRGIKEIRPISTKVALLPRTHGSGLFTRGITQVLTVATLGSPSLELFVQNMYGEKTKKFIHYYNFPPFANGETGRMSGPGSREIGHGMLAERALRPVIPDQKEFPYMIILMSETLSSSGSSSMAATCASTLALMDAGVPIKDMVGGVGVGLIIDDEFTKYKIMTDLAYKEDAYGFLDFKMTGTRTGVTAMQADMKVKGIPFDMMPEILSQSKEARMKVLDELEKTLSKPRSQVSERAPKTMSTVIPVDKIGTLIGSGGRTIKDLQEKTESEIYIEDDGHVVVTGNDAAKVAKALDLIIGTTKDIEEGEVYDGTVKELLGFGALVELFPGKVGLLHISEITNSYVNSVEEFFKIGDVVKVKVIGLGNDGKISLSKKALEAPSEGDGGAGNPRRDSRPHQSDRPRGNFDRGRNHNNR